MAEMKHMANKQMERHMNKAMGTESPQEEQSEGMPEEQATCPACGNVFDPKVQKDADMNAEPMPTDMQPAMQGGDEGWE